MAINKRISYIYHDPDDTPPRWIGYSEDFDDAVTTVADKIAEQVDLRTVDKKKEYIKFITIEDI